MRTRYSFGDLRMDEPGRFHWAKSIMDRGGEPSVIVRSYATRASLLELSVCTGLRSLGSSSSLRSSSLLLSARVREVTASELFRRRAETQTVIRGTGLGGLRVGEALWADGEHGFYANDAAIQLDPSRLPPLTSRL
jgi:hypothetical protein